MGKKHFAEPIDLLRHINGCVHLSRGGELPEVGARLRRYGQPASAEKWARPLWQHAMHPCDVMGGRPSYGVVQRQRILPPHFPFKWMAAYLKGGLGGCSRLLCPGFPCAHHVRAFSIRKLESCLSSLKSRNWLHHALFSWLGRMRFLGDVCTFLLFLDRIQTQFVRVCLLGY